MQTRERVLHHLKRRGSTTVAELAAGLDLSRNAARHHLRGLERSGAVRSTTSGRGTRGRPAIRYELTLTAETAFPKRYPELLAAVLGAAARAGLVERLLASVVEEWAAPHRAALAALPPRRRLAALLGSLGYGDMLPVLREDDDGWHLTAHNCLFRDAGCQVAAVCELLPRLVRAATGLAAERVACQRDGERTCGFTGGWRTHP